MFYSVFEVCAGLKPSQRGELEITDVNNHYIARGEMACMQLHSWWCDVGTFEGIRDATELVRRLGANKDGNGGVTILGASNDGVVRGNEGSALRFRSGRELTVLVTGGCGFIGSHFLRLLARVRPNWKLINLDCRTYAGQADNLADVRTHPNYEWIEVWRWPRALHAYWDAIA